MTKSKHTDEKILADRAYAGYLAGRLAGAVTADSSARAALVTRYSAPSRQRVEQYTFLLGLREAGCPVLDPGELLSVVCATLGIGTEEAAS